MDARCRLAQAKPQKHADMRSRASITTEKTNPSESERAEHIVTVHLQHAKITLKS